MSTATWFLLGVLVTSLFSVTVGFKPSAVFEDGRVVVSQGVKREFIIEPPVYDTGSACTKEPVQPMRIIPVGIIQVDHGASW